MQVIPYLSFKGDCEAAFELYARVFGGRVGMIHRYAGSPMAESVPPDWGQKVMHGSVTVRDQTLMGSDNAAATYDEPKGFSLSIQLSDPAEAERLFGALADGGRVLMRIEKTFWAERFGYVIDRFGIPWTINCETPQA